MLLVQTRGAGTQIRTITLEKGIRDRFDISENKCALLVNCLSVREEGSLWIFVLFFVSDKDEVIEDVQGIRGCISNDFVL